MTCRILGSLTLLIVFAAIIVSSVDAGQSKPKGGLLGETSLHGRVVEVNQEHRFVVVNLGSAEGAETGMVLSIFQKGEEAGKVKLTKVRRHISAGNIQMLYSGRGVAVGDEVIYKIVPPLVKMFQPLDASKQIAVESIVVDIDAPKQTIMSKMSAVFKDFGLIITDSDPDKHTLTAFKYTENRWDVDLVTDWGPFVRNKISYTAEVTTTPRYNRLIIHLRGVYDREGQVFDHEIEKDSSVYKETQKIAFTIKDLAEEL
ncbi:MAG: hypothetical protein HQ595_00335 [Candidatus Omnitrophica bacterium]|nr:hypothetical protein [Candidatus Omnitrophota bacterium]